MSNQKLSEIRNNLNEFNRTGEANYSPSTNDIQFLLSLIEKQARAISFLNSAIKSGEFVSDDEVNQILSEGE